MPPEQSYATHVYRPVAWSITWLLAVVAEVLILVAVFTQPFTLLSIGTALLGAVAVLTISLLRVFALRLQNRIIRTEMQVRLMRLNRDGDLERLTMAQVVALRFASDAELPALVDRAAAERMTSDQIKRAVTNWQGDHLRT